jgi:hypothetical protein
MKIELNNPLPLVSVALLGAGVDVQYARNDEGHHICMSVEIIVWEWCKEWTVRKTEQ